MILRETHHNLFTTKNIINRTINIVINKYNLKTFKICILYEDRQSIKELYTIKL